MGWRSRSRVFMLIEFTEQRMPAENEQFDLLVISDLHLSEGRHPKTGAISPLEDFLFDEEFARFLRYYADSASGGERRRKWHLIINGDFVDFLQVVSTDITDEFREYLGAATNHEALAQLRFDRSRQGYGFSCGSKETVCKLWKVMDGHELFFQALAGFVAEGNRLSLTRGNHDAEWFFPEVQAALVPKMRRIYKESLKRESSATVQDRLDRFDRNCRAGGVRFLDWFYFEPGLLWVEHGNQYDEVNCFKYALAPQVPKSRHVAPGREDEIDLPWGSLFVRYLFNKVELDEPLADNIKPQTEFLRWFVLTHPIVALRFLYRDGHYMLHKMRRSLMRLPASAYAQREQEHSAKLRQLAREWRIAEEDLRQIDAWRAPNILKEKGATSGRRFFLSLTRRRFVMPLVSATWILLLAQGVLLFGGMLWFFLPPSLRHVGNKLGVVSWLAFPFRLVVGGLEWNFLLLILAAIGYLVFEVVGEKKKEAEPLVEAAEKIASKLGVRYVTMGHTHDTDLRQLQNGGEYFNTGTWTKVFSEEERLVREESELVFVQATRGEEGLKVKLLKWNDPANEPRLVKLLS
jgi:UDP-2,3-diacylglucosamine pyrophosphatase LpxH